jgi:multimeric flavodoxin WrbA
MSEPLLLGIAGSPRRGGNSDRVLAACLESAEALGVRTARMVAADLTIGPCRGCNACSETGECIQDDGMTDVYRALDAAAAIVIASPVFFAGVPAQLKALIDRLQPYWARRFVLGQPLARRRPGAVLLVRAGGDPYGFRGAEDTLRSALAVVGVDIVEVVVVEGVDAPRDADTHPEAVARAAAVGRHLAALIGGTGMPGMPVRA